MLTMHGQSTVPVAFPKSDANGKTLPVTAKTRAAQLSTSSLMPTPTPTAGTAILHQQPPNRSSTRRPVTSWTLVENATSFDFFNRLVCRTDTLSTPTHRATTTTTTEIQSTPINLSFYGIHVPRIVVMGDTSAGKSSLLAQLCGIELPAAHVLTTKCPIRLHLQNNNRPIDPSNETGEELVHRQATIAVEWQLQRGTIAVGPTNYPEFTPVVLTVHQGDNDRNEAWRHEVSAAISRAQLFILHHTNASVSNHVVVVKIHGPEYMTHELTVVDLPGLVRSKPGVDESDTLASEIAALQQEYLSQSSRSILVVVHPANLDWHNAQITADALRVDPETTRTMAVLVKPDLIDRGAEADVVQLLNGQHMAFSLGWHMVKCRGQAALDARQSIDEALMDESRFFDTVEPWKSVTNRSLFGSVNLRQKLSDLLVHMIRSTLPSILVELRERHQTVVTRLEVMNETGALLKTASDRRRHYQTLSRTVVAQITASLTGKLVICGEAIASLHRQDSSVSTALRSPSNRTRSAAARLHDYCAHFRDRILEGSLATIRKVVEGSAVLVMTTQRGQGIVRGEIAHITDTFACVDYVDPVDRHSDVLFEATGLKGSHSFEENDLWTQKGKILLGRAKNEYDILNQIPLDRIRTDPTWLKEKIANNRTDDLACFLNINIFKNVIDDFITADWQPHAARLLGQTRETIYSTMEEVIRNHGTTDETGSASNRYPLLTTLIAQHCRMAAKSLLQNAHNQISAHFEVEKHPYTQNKDLFENIARSKHMVLRRDLNVALKVDSEGVFDTQAIKALMDDVFERQQQKPMEDQMAEEMEIVLDSYGSVSAQRIVDRTPMICWEVFRLLPNAMHDVLGKVTDDVLERYMPENPQFERQHQAITDELADLTKAMEHFELLM